MCGISTYCEIIYVMIHDKLRRFFHFPTLLKHHRFSEFRDIVLLTFIQLNSHIKCAFAKNKESAVYNYVIQFLFAGRRQVLKFLVFRLVFG